MVRKDNPARSPVDLEEKRQTTIVVRADAKARYPELRQGAFGELGYFRSHAAPALFRQTRTIQPHLSGGRFDYLEGGSRLVEKLSRVRRWRPASRNYFRFTVCPSTEAPATGTLSI
jgi:hypothetical protein